jgi:hypothetical protein
MQRYLTAICFYKFNSQPPLKYRNIKNIDKFEAFIIQRGVWYVNYYDKKTKAFIERKYLY